MMGDDSATAPTRSTRRRRTAGWACRIRTSESVREPPNWICVTISPEVGASPAAETLRVRAAWRLRAGIHNRVRAMGIRDRPISPRSPWQNPVAERLIGTRTAFARGSDSAAAPVRPSSTEASVALRTSSGPSPGTVRLCSEPAFS